MQETDISSTADGIFYGFVISAVLLGVTIEQGWTYIHNNNDKSPIRTFVIVLILLDVAETCCSTQLLHHYFIKNFGSLSVLRTPTSLVSADFAITGAIMFLVHIFFASRFFLFGKDRLFPGFIVFCSVAMLGLGISSIPIQSRDHFRGTRLRIHMAVFHVLGVFIDIMVTIGLCIKVSPSKVQFEKTKMIFHQLLMYSITRGILITFVQLTHVVMFIVEPSKLLFWISLHFILSKLYVITTLVILNTRASRREKLGDVVMLGSLPLSFAHSLSTLSTDVDTEANLHLDHATMKARTTTSTNKT